MVGSFWCPTRVVVGEGAVGAIPAELNAFGIRRPLVVTDRGLLRAGVVDHVLRVLDGAGMPYEVYSGVEPQPPCRVVFECLEAYRQGGCDGFLAVGGGSAIDTAKAAAILATNGGHPRDYHGFDRFRHRPAPVAAVPTTAGTGSEVSAVASVTDEERQMKLSLRSSRWVPPLVSFLDPVMVAGLPRHVAVVTAMDALTHNVESYTSREATGLSEAVSLRGMELAGRYLRAFIADRSDREAAAAMQIAAALGGIGFSAAGTGNVHCLARFLAGRFGMEHGMACAVALPYVVAWNAPAHPEKFARVAAALGAPVDGLSPREAAGLAAGAIHRLNDDLGVPRSLRPFGVGPQDVDRLAEECAGAGYDRWNPRPTGLADWKRLIAAMVAGEPLAPARS